MADQEASGEAGGCEAGRNWARGPLMGLSLCLLFPFSQVLEQLLQGTGLASTAQEA